MNDCTLRWPCSHGPRWTAAVVAGVSLWMGPCSNLIAAELYDLVISRGRVIDPDSGLDGVRDVAIVADKIVALSEER